MQPRPRPIPTNVERTLSEGDFIVSKTDTKGIITYGNEVFIDICRYSEEDLLGANHNIIRHPDMPAAVFKLLWDKIEAKQEIFAYVKNLAKDGAYYWVWANCAPSFDAEGNVVGYLSVRRKPKAKAIAALSGIYADLLAEERKYPNRKQGAAASLQTLSSLLSAKGVSYDEFILNL